MRKIRGDDGWILLAIFVFLWDWFADETLSSALWRGLEHPWKKFPVIATVLWVVSHLLFRKPRRILIWR